MINGPDSLTCQNMIFWYEIDSLHAYGNVKFKFKDNKLETDSLIYVETNGFRGYSFESLNGSKFIDDQYQISAKEIKYNDITQNMKLLEDAKLKTDKQGASGNIMNLNFQDSLITDISIENNGYLFNNHYAIVNKFTPQLFQDDCELTIHTQLYLKVDLVVSNYV